MSDSETYNPNDLEDYSLPDPEHVETMFTAYQDTVVAEQAIVEGNEALVTPAMHYAGGVLASSGAIPFKAITGNESFVGSIKDGAKKVWEYIKKMFSWIFGGFFKKEAKEEMEETKTVLKKTEEVLKKQEGTITFQAGSFKASVKRKDASPAAQQLLKDIDDIQAQVKESGSAPQTKVKELAKEIFNTNLINSEKLGRTSVALEIAFEALVKARDRYNSKEDMTAISVQTFLNGLTGLPELAGKIHDLASAKEFISKSGRCLEAIKNNFESLKTHEKDILRSIVEIENNTAVNDNAVTVKGKIEALKKELTEITTVCRLGSNVMGYVKDISDVIKAACVVG